MKAFTFEQKFIRDYLIELCLYYSHGFNTNEGFGLYFLQIPTSSKVLKAWEEEKEKEFKYKKTWYLHDKYQKLTPQQVYNFSKYVVNYVNPFEYITIIRYVCESRVSVFELNCCKQFNGELKIGLEFQGRRKDFLEGNECIADIRKGKWIYLDKAEKQSGLGN